MKKLMMMMALAAFCLTTNAQNSRHEVGTFTVQPMAGLSVGSMGGTVTYYMNANQQNIGIEDEMRLGFTAGAEAEYYINDWFSATAGINYTQQGWRIKEKNSGDKFNQNLDYLNIPVMANFYVLKGFALKIGVQPGFLLNAKYDGHDNKKGYESFNFSIPFGLSYEFANGITLDWRTMIAVTRANKNSTSEDKYYSHCAWLTVGYKFSL